MRFPHAVALLASAALAGCPDNVKTPFDPKDGYQPIEPSTAAFPPPEGDDRHPEAIQIVAGWREGRLAFAHGAAYLHASLPQVLEALRDPRVSRIHGTDSWYATPNVEPDYPISFSIRYAAGPAIYKGRWTIVYRGGPLLGTMEAPEQIGFRYQKVDGIEDIRVQSGSLVAYDAGDGVTALEVVCHLDTSSRADQGPDNVYGTVNDWWVDLRAKVRGEPVP
ncbi:hypothetical protein [Anaeromyxobacter terrae]|uniref:hypothetical protein n=1 Tax=Anaeromyxobacter terrae TaxID=2925406 RepID=UPI001F55C7F0|nr:hypothetical protein [Anaeromyxobacter sp. SG22]